MYPGVEEESKAYEISSLIRKLDSSVSYKNPAGFALFRIKSFISCQDETIQNYNEDQLKIVYLELKMELSIKIYIIN